MTVAPAGTAAWQRRVRGLLCSRNLHAGVPERNYRTPDGVPLESARPTCAGTRVNSSGRLPVAQMANQGDGLGWRLAFDATVLAPVHGPGYHMCFTQEPPQQSVIPEQVVGLEIPIDFILGEDLPGRKFGPKKP